MLIRRVCGCYALYDYLKPENTLVECCVKLSSLCGCAQLCEGVLHCLFPL